MKTPDTSTCGRIITRFPQMKRWSAAKLAKEASFARAIGSDADNAALASSVEAEVTRRYGPR